MFIVVAKLKLIFHCSFWSSQGRYCYRFCIESESECWVFYAVMTARVIFTTKTSLDFSVLVENKFGLF